MNTVAVDALLKAMLVNIVSAGGDRLVAVGRNQRIVQIDAGGFADF